MSGIIKIMKWKGTNFHSNFKTCYAMHVVKSFKDIHKCRSRIEPGNEYCGVLDGTNYSKKKT